MAMTLTTRQHVVYTLAFKKDDGSDGVVEAGSVTAMSSDETQITAAVLADGTVDVMSVAASKPGESARFVIKADADTGAGVVEITGTSEDITVTADPRDMANTVTITGGAPVDK